MIVFMIQVFVTTLSNVTLQLIRQPREAQSIRAEQSYKAMEMEGNNILKLNPKHSLSPPPPDAFSGSGVQVHRPAIRGAVAGETWQ